MKNTMLWVAGAVVIAVAAFFAFNTYIYNEKQADLSAYTLGSYGYRCGDGTEFTVSPAADMSTIRIVPATSVERIPETILSKGPGEGAEYAGNGIMFIGAGESVTLKTSDFSIECNPMFLPDEAPFNWGDPGEGAGKAQEVVPAVVLQLLGTWQSNDDALFTREFRSGGVVVDSYKSEVVTADSWSVFTEAGVSYLRIRTQGGDEMIFRMVRVTPETLELVYLDEGATYTYTRLQSPGG